MVTHPNSPPRAAPHIYDDTRFLAEATDPASLTVGEFEAQGRRFKILSTFRRELGDGTDDENDHEALCSGLKELWRFIAVRDDCLPVAVWEMYHAPPERFRSKAIEVDHRCQTQRIGTEFALGLYKHAKFEWSGTYTAAGARLKDAVEARVSDDKSVRP